METRTLIPAKNWNDYHDFPNTNELENYVFNQKDNGFYEFNVVKKLGKLVLIDEAAFFKWMKKELVIE